MPKSVVCSANHLNPEFCRMCRYQCLFVLIVTKYSYVCYASSLPFFFEQVIASFFFVNTQKHSHPTLQLFLISEDIGMSFPSFLTKRIIWYLRKWNLHQVCVYSSTLIRNTIMGLDAVFEVDGPA